MLFPSRRSLRWREAAHSCGDSGLARWPVVEHDKLVGVHTRSDILDAMLAEEMEKE